MGVSTAAGAKLYIGTTAADPVTDTYVRVSQVVSLPEIGRTWEEIAYKTLDERGTQVFKSFYDDGGGVIALGKDINDAGQAAMLLARDSDNDYNFKVEDNDDVAPASATVTITVAEPGVVTWTAHGLPVNTAVRFTTTGTLPTGLTAGATVYVKEVLTADTFSVSATKGGAAIETTSTQSGVHTGTTVPAGSYETFKAKVMSYTTARGDGSSVIGANASIRIKSGSGASQIHLP